MNLKELLEKRAALLAEIGKPETTKERFDELRGEIDRLDVVIEAAKKQEEEQRSFAKHEEEIAKHEKEMRGARLPSGGAGEQYNQKEATQRSAEAEFVEKRAKALKNNEVVTLERRMVSVGSAAMGVKASATINDTFSKLSTVDQLVSVESLVGSGAESFKKPYVKTYPTGGITGEGEAYTTTEPTFSYATVNKIKVTAYAEISEEMEKLPSANYVEVVNKAIRDALKIKIVQQIIGGTGTGEMLGILNAPEAMMPKADCEKVVGAIDENTIDNIIFDYGGDENVEGDAVLILNKSTLREFAKVKGSDKKRAYDIVVNGNTGTINGVPYVISSNIAAYTSSLAAGTPYLIYGKMNGYVMAEFTDIDVKRSPEYKFKEGMVAYRASQFVGGSPAMYKGFLKIVRTKTTG